MSMLKQPGRRIYRGWLLLDAQIALFAFDLDTQERWSTVGEVPFALLRHGRQTDAIIVSQ